MLKKEDRRIKLTKLILKKTLIDMLKEKDIYHISIRDLCKKADVNRTTFYKHYGSQFELLSDMENDMLQYIDKALSQNEEEQEILIKNACEYLEENIEFIKIIVNNNVDSSFPRKLFELPSIKRIAKKWLPDYESEAEFEYLYTFLTYGICHAICVWVRKKERESPEMLANMINKLLSR